MSTRSGKRIHTSLLEDTATMEVERAVKTERKTRSKRVKENLDELSDSIYKNKKRNNYVSYPTDDELLGDTTIKKKGEVKPSKALRKNALKDHNPTETSTQEEVQDEAKSNLRKSRRYKKFDDAEETENHENIPVEVTEVPKSKKSKKKTKVSIIETVPAENIPPLEEAPAKKSKKKKNKRKKTSSMIIEDIPQNDSSKNGTLNRSNMSVDSFHSAAGSPSYKNDDVDMVHDKKVNTTIDKAERLTTPSKSNGKNTKKHSNNNIFDKNDASVNISTDRKPENINTNQSAKLRKPIPEETTLDQCFVSVSRDNLEKGLEDILNVSNLSNGKHRTRKSVAKDATFDKCNISTNLENDVESNLNDSKVSNHSLKRRKSSIIKISEDVNDVINNGTFDKGLRRSSVVKDVTFDKNNASIVKEINDNDVSNISNKQYKTRRSAVKDSTFDKSNSSIPKDDLAVESDLDVSRNRLKSRQSMLKDSIFDKSNASIANDNIIKKDEETDVNISSKQLRRRKSNIKDSIFDKQETLLNTTFEKETENSKDRKKDFTFNKSNDKHLAATYEKHQEPTSTSKTKDNNSSANTTYDKTEIAGDTTFEKDTSASFNAFKKGAMTRKSSIRDASFDKSNFSITSLLYFEKDNNIISSSTKKRRSLRHTFDKNDTITENVVNTTYEKSENAHNEPKRKSPRLAKTQDIQAVLNTTFEKENTNEGQENFISGSNSKSSLISSDNSSVTDKSEISRISITSDDTSAENVENIINTTPLLIESSIDETHTSVLKLESPKPKTPLKREGTFTKDGPDQIESEVQTPTKRETVRGAGCTPYHSTKSSQKKKILNVTRSLEKGVHATVEPALRLTRVMFCSPVDSPATFTQEKKKIIKSNLKGSNKSFVFDENVPESTSRAGRKRSYTQNDAEDARVKRSRLAEDLQHSVDRLSRPRTASVTGKLSVVTPKKPSTPSKPKSEGKPLRTKLPNFAAMHQKRFDKMESLNECQERKAKRAKQLLTPTAPPGLLERISPKNNTESPKKSKELAKPKEKTDTPKKVTATEPTRPAEKTDTPTKKLLTQESSRPGFTRFGFKLNLDVNPFSIPSKTVEKPKEKPIEKPNGVLPRQGALPSLAGRAPCPLHASMIATSLRREVAKLTVMREKSFTDRRNLKRNENRTVIKGVRTNRRFELQMKMRNIN